MSRLTVTAPDDEAVLQKFDDSLVPGVFDEFEAADPEVVDVDYGERRSLVKVTLEKWVD